MLYDSFRDLYARLHGTDEEDVVKDDEDTDVDAQHDGCTARGKAGIVKGAYICVCVGGRGGVSCHLLWKDDNLNEGDETEDQ